MLSFVNLGSSLIVCVVPCPIPDLVGHVAEMLERKHSITLSCEIYASLEKSCSQRKRRLSWEE